MTEPTELSIARWQRRERKLSAKKKAMRISGAGLKKVTLPLIKRKAEKAEKTSTERRDQLQK